LLGFLFADHIANVSKMPVDNWRKAVEKHPFSVEKAVDKGLSNAQNVRLLDLYSIAQNVRRYILY